MNRASRGKAGNVERKSAIQRVKIVAEMPEDKEIQANLEEMKKNDGYPGSCGI